MSHRSARDPNRPRTFYDSAIAPPLRLILATVAVGLIAVAGVGLYWFTATPVTVNLNGRLTVIRTHQATVDGLIHEVANGLNESDSVTPFGQTTIHNGLIVTIQTARSVVIDVDGQPRQIRTRSTDPQTILTQAGVTLGAHDILSTNGDDDLVVMHAQPIQIQDGSQAAHLTQTTARTVGGALAEAGVALYTADTVTPALDSSVRANMTITIARSVPITVQVDGQTLNTRTVGKSVGDALNKLGVGLVGQDRSVPDFNQPIAAAMMIQVIRVTETEEVTQISIPFPIVEQADSGLLPGQQKVITPGVPGVAAIYMQVHREDGIAISRSMPLRFVIQPPIAQIVAVSPADLPTTTAVPNATPGS